MTTVTVLPTAFNARGPLTRRDLEDLPWDDGRRWELVDGVLLVSPAPRVRHQEVVGNLYLLLRATCPPDLRVVLSPFAVGLADDTEIQPDLLVAPRAQFTDRDLPGAPLLAVEVLSPSTRRVDLLLKRDRLQEAGCPSYWLVDPEALTVLVLELVDGAYAEVASGPGPVGLQRPFPVRLDPAALLD